MIVNNFVLELLELTGLPVGILAWRSGLERAVNFKRVGDAQSRNSANWEHEIRNLDSAMFRLNKDE